MVLKTNKSEHSYRQLDKILLNSQFEINPFENKEATSYFKEIGHLYCK